MNIHYLKSCLFSGRSCVRNLFQKRHELLPVHRWGLALFFFWQVIFCQRLLAQKYFSAVSEISFYSEAPLEKIQAGNKDGKSVMNIATKEIAFVVPIRGFHFEKPLMEEHFNENYMESAKFKTAAFKGVINDDLDYETDGVLNTSVSGTMSIHGIEKNYTVPGKITVKGEKISIDAKFKVKVADHNIAIPQLVIRNIAEEVEVTVHFEYEEKK